MTDDSFSADRRTMLKAAAAGAALLAPGGVACVEIGAGQAESVAALFEREGLSASLRADLSGRPRCVVLTT